MVSDTEIAEARKLQRNSRGVTFIYLLHIQGEVAHRGHYGAAPTPSVLVLLHTKGTLSLYV